MPKHEVGFRIQLTAANSEAEIALLNDVLTDLAGAGLLRREDTVDERKAA